MIINILSVTYYTFTGIVFIFILLGISGKFGLFPLNLGIFGIVDGCQRKVLFIDRVTGYSNGFEGVITKVMYNQSINSTSINTCVMQSTIETRVVKVGDFVIIKEEYILYKGNPFEHGFLLNEST